MVLIKNKTQNGAVNKVLPVKIVSGMNLSPMFFPLIFHATYNYGIY